MGGVASQDKNLTIHETFVRLQIDFADRQTKLEQKLPYRFALLNYALVYCKLITSLGVKIKLTIWKEMPGDTLDSSKAKNTIPNMQPITIFCEIHFDMQYESSLLYISPLGKFFQI